MPDDLDWTHVPQGDRSLLIRFAQDEKIDQQVGLRCVQAAHVLRQLDLPGVVDIVPSFNAVALHYFPSELTLAQRQEQIDRALRHAFSEATHLPAQKTVDIPVCYGHDYGPDLSDLAGQLALPPEQLIDLHSRETLMVFMIGFAPGAPYVGVHAPELDVPRRATPRTHIAAGSVAIANRQSIIYPNVSPGGWHVIGRTPLSLFQAQRPAPSLMAPGDQIRFVPITPADFENWPLSS